MSPTDRVALLRTRDVPTQVVGYSDAELQERALAEALAAARALGRAWRRRQSRTQRLALLEALGAPEPLERSVVDALIKHTLAGGFRIVERPGLVGGRGPRQCRPDHERPYVYTGDGHLVDHEPFELTRRIPFSLPDERRSD